MRHTLNVLALLVAAFLMAAKPAVAQLNCFSYSNELAKYSNVSADSTSIYTAVAIDGSQEMNAWGQCAQFVGYAVHTSHVFNQLSTPEQTVGGWSTGDGVCASCYISFGTNEFITPLPGEQVEFENEVMANCSFGSTIFDSGNDIEPVSSCKAERRFSATCQRNGNHLDLFASYGVFGSTCSYTSVVYSTPFSGASCGGVNGDNTIVETGNNCTWTTASLSQMELNGDCTGFCGGVGSTIAYTQAKIPPGCSPY